MSLSSIFDTITNFIPPLKTIEEVGKVVLGKETIQQANTNIGNSLLITGGTAAIGGAAVAAAPAFAAASFGTQAGVVAAAPIAIGAAANIFSNPVTAATKISNVAKAEVSFGNDVTNLALNPTKENAISTFKNNPILSTATGLAAAGIVGYGASNLIATVLNTSAVKKNTVATLGPAASPSDSSQILSSATNKNDVKVAQEQTKQAQIAANAPQQVVSSSLTPNPQPAVVAPKKKAKKKAVKKKPKKKAVKKKTVKKSKKKSKTLKKKTTKKK